jgi:hypothetical protein
MTHLTVTGYSHTALKNHKASFLTQKDVSTGGLAQVFIGVTDKPGFPW